MKNFSYKILDEKKKQVEITYKDKTLRFSLKIKRSFIVLKELLKAFPNYYNIHDLDKTLNDPNRAHSDLKIGNGFSNFLDEKRGDDRTMQVKIDIHRLFKYYGHKNTEDFINLSMPEYRGNLSLENKNIIFEKFGGKCNITGIKLNKQLEGVHFFAKSLVTPRYDHRRPVSKNGTDDLENWQIISDYINSEKNKICNICSKNNCEECALAFPEKFDIIQANNQNIDELKLTKR